jgi:phosphomannomutase
MMDKLEAAYAAENPDFTDGIRIQRRNAWFIMRPSSTEFILRVIIEGDDPEVVDAIEDEIRERTEA